MAGERNEVKAEFILISIIVCLLMFGFAFLNQSIKNIWQYLGEKSERDYEIQKSLYAEIRKELEALEKKGTK
jgi:hypothetical protein